MKAIKLVLLVGLFFFNSCRSNDPQANLLIGAWKLAGTKLVTETDWKDTGTSVAPTVIFGTYGILAIGESLLFSGGWCNKAERYVAKERKIVFSFGEPTCIPLVNPQIPAEATIVAISQQALVLEWGNLVLKFERINS